MWPSLFSKLLVHCFKDIDFLTFKRLSPTSVSLSVWANRRPSIRPWLEFSFHLLRSWMIERIVLGKPSHGLYSLKEMVSPKSLNNSILSLEFTFHLLLLCFYFSFSYQDSSSLLFLLFITLWIFISCYETCLLEFYTFGSCIRSILSSY